MHITVASYAHRKLRRLERYISRAELDSKFNVFARTLPCEIGEIVGCYRNDFDNPERWITFTESGLYTKLDGDSRFVPYSEIVRVVWEPDKYKDCESSDVVLQLKANAHVTLEVIGKDMEHGTHDKYPVRMFLENAVGAAQRKQRLAIDQEIECGRIS